MGYFAGRLFPSGSQFSSQLEMFGLCLSPSRGQRHLQHAVRSQAVPGPVCTERVRVVKSLLPNPSSILRGPAVSSFILSITALISPALSFPVRAMSRALFFLSGALGLAAGAGCEKTLHDVVPWPQRPPVEMSHAWLGKELQETDHFTVPIAVTLSCRGCSSSRAG